MEQLFLNWPDPPEPDPAESIERSPPALPKPSTKPQESKPQDPKQPSFEEALGQLEAIVRQLEDGELGLDEALARYEQGVKLLRQCHDQLQRAERRIELLTGVDSEGNPVCTPMDDPSLSLDEKAKQRSRRRSSSSLRSSSDADKTSEDAEDAD